MSIWDRIRHAVSSAASTVAGAAEDAAGKAGAAGASAVNASRDTGIFAGEALRDRSVIFRQGWQQVFSGDAQTGFTNVGFGMAQLATGSQPPAWVAEKYRDTAGDATQWAYQEYTRKENQPVCYTAYRTQMQAGLAKRGVKWMDPMDGELRGLVTSYDLYFIELAC